MACHPE